MPLASQLDGEACPECGEEDLVWWREDETETVCEVYMTCRGCGFEYPKLVVQKAEDTTRSTLIERLKERHL